MSPRKALGPIACAAAVFFTGSLGTWATRLVPEAQASALEPAYLDKLLAPIALYPDPLLAQMLLCAGKPPKLRELSAWLRQNAQLKGSELQQAAESAGFEPSFVALALFPRVVDQMAGDMAWTSELGGAFALDRSSVFESIQRLRAQSQAAGNLKSTPQQTVESRSTSSGEQVIVIEPANPQVVYVPQYNPTVVYTQPASTTVVVVKEEEHHDDAAVAGAVVGFAAGIAIGAAMDNHYYYGPYGWYGGGARMYNDGWNDWYDDRADAREDWYENREDARENYSENRQDMAEQRSERASDAREQRSERASNVQEQRGERASDAQQQRSERQAAGRTEAQGKAQQAKSTSAERSGTRSDAFSNYSSGKSTRQSSSRGESSRSSSRGSRGSRR